MNNNFPLEENGILFASKPPISPSDFADPADDGYNAWNSWALPKVVRNLAHRSSNSRTAISFLSSVPLLFAPSALFPPSSWKRRAAPSHLRFAVKRSLPPFERTNERSYPISPASRALSSVDPERRSAYLPTNEEDREGRDTGIRSVIPRFSGALSVFWILHLLHGVTLLSSRLPRITLRISPICCASCSALTHHCRRPSCFGISDLFIATVLKIPSRKCSWILFPFYAWKWKSGESKVIGSCRDQSVIYACVHIFDRLKKFYIKFFFPSIFISRISLFWLSNMGNLLINFKM